MMRYLCRPGGQHDAVNSGTGLETQRGVNRTSGLTQPAPDSAPYHNTEQSVAVAPSQSVGRGGWLHTGRQPVCWDSWARVETWS